MQTSMYQQRDADKDKRKDKNWFEGWDCEVLKKTIEADLIQI